MKSYVLSLLLLTSILNAQSVVINEVMSSNSSTIKDEDNDYPDWIELYNKADTNINLNQYSLSDDPSDSNKWIFPNVDLNSKSFLLVFASGKNKTSEQLHTNFKIKSCGERIWLRDPNGNLVDNIDSVNIPSNI